VLTTIEDGYLKKVSAVIVDSIQASIGDAMDTVTEISRTATEDESPLLGATVEEVRYHGSLYDAVFTKEKGPSMTIRMVLRHR